MYTITTRKFNFSEDKEEKKSNLQKKKIFQSTFDCKKKEEFLLPSDFCFALLFPKVNQSTPAR